MRHNSVKRKLLQGKPVFGAEAAMDRYAAFAQRLFDLATIKSR